ncbi:hypothetical protein [Amylibacter sp. IMCC11727]|uniref:hypothetical protein n=1 Tax=Amylibacter sp. IMCC11727 TaxID=3039851 RepID=UPI00244DDCEF|nr:hypothetical protein [Amylibacter sp. IMCC11727]WGI21079.1 hypothetical protein QBD29_13315 [Amylibacter sp. IMCC11727]
MYIEIIKRPNGEAPEWVRDAWIGLRLPLYHHLPVTSKVQGVVTGSRTRLGAFLKGLVQEPQTMTGYYVHSKGAIEILAAFNTDAAKWWVDNAPHSLEEGQVLMFETQVCGNVING